MPWTLAVVDLRIVSLPDRQDVRAPFPQPPSCLQADGARRSNPPPCTFISAIWPQRLRVRLASRRERQLAAASVRASSIFVVQADARINTRVATADKESPCRTVTVIPYAAHLYLCLRKASRRSSMRASCARPPCLLAFREPRQARRLEKNHELRPPSFATASRPGIARPLRRHAGPARV